MLPPLERALSAAREAKTLADAFRRREISPLRVGREYSIPASVLTPAMAALRSSNSAIELSLCSGSQTDLCERILRGEIDLALLVDGPDVPERLHRWRMYAERYVVIFQPEHRFGLQESVTPGDLAEECLLLLADEACPVRKYLTGLWTQNGLKPQRQHFGNSTDQLTEMVRAMLGVSIYGERYPATPALLLKWMRAQAWGQDRNSAPPLATAVA